MSIGQQVLGAGALSLSILDTDTGQPIVADPSTYSGPVIGLQRQYVYLGSHNVCMSVSTANWFLHGGSGDDALAVYGGTNVLDGGAGSNFLSGGSGTDTFILDDRNLEADVWSTVARFHAGDAATVFGLTANGADIQWTDGQGATGYTGLTLHVKLLHHPIASMTFAGYSTADLSNGRLSVTYGTELDGTPYMYVLASGSSPASPTATSDPNAISALPSQPGDIVGIRLQNTSSLMATSSYLSFGEVFLPGAVKLGDRLIARIDGLNYVVQVDVKSTNTDASVRQAILTLDAPVIAAGGTLDLVLAKDSASAPLPAAPNIFAISAGGYDFTVGLTVHNRNGSTTGYRLNAGTLLSQALASGKVTYWMQGPLATEARFDVPISGSFHVTFDVTDFADGTTRTGVQFENDYAQQPTGGAITYDETVTQNGLVVSTYSGLKQYQYQARREVFWSNGAPQVNIIHDVGALERTGAIQGYDLGYDQSLNTGGPRLAGEASALASSGWGGALPVNGVTQYMPGTGGRPDVGSSTGADVLWLMTQDPTAAQYALGQADAAGSVPWHFYDPSTNSYLNVFQYPKIWSGYTGTPNGLTQGVDTNGSGWTPDQAHQPDLSYVAYLLTGDQYYLDQLNAQADASIFGSWYGFKNQGAYVDIVVNGYDQIRQQAWNLRQIDEAAWANPDGSLEKAYFTRVASDNWNYLVSQLPSWTTMEGQAYGYIPYFQMRNGMQISPWMEDYFATSVIQAAEQGNQSAVTVLNWMSNYLVGRFLPHTGWNQYDGAAYRNVTTDSSGNYNQTWGAIETATQAGGFSNGSSFLTADYNELAMSSLAGIITVTGSPQAMQAYGWLLPRAPNLYGEPQLDIAPRLPDGNFLYSNQVTVDTTSGNLTLSAKPGTDSLLTTSGTGLKVLNGSTGAIDLLYGGPGTNTLNAGSGNDYLFGGSGTNTFVDNTGNNYLVGGGSSNLYMFEENSSGHDFIANFNVSTDRLRVGPNLNGNGITTAPQLIAGATLSNGNTVLHLGSTNDITLLGVSQPSGLINSILVS